MEFIVTVEGIDYSIQTSKEQSLSYLTEHNGKKYELVLGDDNEWLGVGIPSGSLPIPVDAIGLAIQAKFNPKIKD